jgi:hypothetical protein
MVFPQSGDTTVAAAGTAGGAGSEKEEEEEEWGLKWYLNKALTYVMGPSLANTLSHLLGADH